jgi:hypothetical protein
VAVYFVETSALAKRYIAEVGSLWLRALLHPGTVCPIYVVRVTGIEMIAPSPRHHLSGHRGDPRAGQSSHAPRREAWATWV